MANARDMAITYAPFVNSYKRYQLGSWAPTAIVWSRDNRTCGFRTVGEHTGSRVECRIPGADANPYLAFASTIASGLWGIAKQGSSLRRCLWATPTRRRTCRACRRRSTRRSRPSAEARFAREGFGDFVFEHLLNTAVQEQIIFDNNCVTDWELARYFERVEAWVDHPFQPAAKVGFSAKYTSR